MDYQGKVALLTGAGGGIGIALTEMLAKLGFTLVLVGRTEAKLLSAAKQAGCENPICITGDLMDAAFLQSVIPQALGAAGRLDCLINNAGICFVKDMKDTAYDELDAMLRTNVYAPYILCRDAIEPMKRSDCATIINIGSVVSHKGYATQSAYATAKHALLGMTKALATETYKDGIRCHILCPGAVNTEMAQTISRPDIDMNALIAPQDIADIAEFLITHRTNAVIDEVCIHRVGKAPF